MPAKTTSELRRPRWALLFRRPWTALLYVLLEALAGWTTVAAVGTILLIPAWLVAWPQIEQRILPLAGHPIPAVHRTAPLEVRWRDWALVLLTPVAGFAGTAVLGLGIVVPTLLILSPVRIAITGVPVTILSITIDTPGSQVAAVLIGTVLLTLALGVVTVLAYGWGRLSSSLLSDEERRLTEQVTALSDGTARALDQLALERRQLERDLHDGAQMHLGAAGTRLGMLQLEAEDLPDSASRGTILAAIDAVRDQLDDAATAIRTSVHGLVPTPLIQGGLCAAIEAATRAIPLVTRLQCDIPRLDTRTEIGLYYIVTEALANVVRHARAGHVDIVLAEDGSQIILDISDDGRGGAKPTGTGLLSIQARARLLGGQASIYSPPGEGTTIAVRVPRPVVTVQSPTQDTPL